MNLLKSNALYIDSIACIRSTSNYKSSRMDLWLLRLPVMLLRPAHHMPFVYYTH